MGVLEVKLPGRVLRLNPRRRVATVGVAVCWAGSVVSGRLCGAG